LKGIKPGLQSERPSTNHLSLGTDCRLMFGSELWRGPSASYICQVLPWTELTVHQKHHTQSWLYIKNIILRVDGTSKTSYSTQDLEHESSVFHLSTTHSVHIRGTSILLITLKTATKCGREAQHNTIW